jgi:hypothetical protein
MPAPIGAAHFIVCPACGVGEVTRLCTITQGQVESLICDACDLYLRNAVVIARGVAIDPDDVVELGRAKAPFASVDELYVTPDRRPVRLEVSWPGRPMEGAPALPVVSSITLHFARERNGQ